MAKQSEIVSAINELMTETTHEDRYQILRGFAKRGDGRSDMLSALLCGNTIKDNMNLLQCSSLGAHDIARLIKACTDFMTATLIAEEVRAGLHGNRNPGVVARMPGIGAWVRRVRRAHRK